MVDLSTSSNLRHRDLWWWLSLALFFPGLPTPEWSQWYFLFAGSIAAPHDRTWNSSLTVYNQHTGDFQASSTRSDLVRLVSCSPQAFSAISQFLLRKKKNKTTFEIGVQITPSLPKTWKNFIYRVWISHVGRCHNSTWKKRKDKKEKNYMYIVLPLSVSDDYHHFWFAKSLL